MKYPKPQKALVAVGVGGRAIFLAIEGEELTTEVEEIDNDVVSFLGEHPKDPGLYVWEGVVNEVNTSAWDETPYMELEYTGTFRPAAWMDGSAFPIKLELPTDVAVDKTD